MNKFVLHFVKLTGWPIAHFYYRKKNYYEDKSVQGRKLNGAAVVVSNHTSVYDYPLTMFTFNRSTVRTLTAEVLFNRGKAFAWFLTAMGCVRVDRGNCDFSFLSTMSDCLAHGETCLVYPEGRLPTENDPAGELLEFKSSYVYLALTNNVPVIPVYTNGVYGKQKRKKHDVARIIIGKPIFLNDLYDSALSEEQNIAVLNAYVKQRVEQLGKLLRQKQNEQKKK